MVREPLLLALLVFTLCMLGAWSLYPALFPPSRGGDERLRDPASRLRGQRSVLIRNSVELAGFPGRIMVWWLKRLRQAQSDKPGVRRIQSALISAGFAGLDKVVFFRILQILSVAAFGGAGLLAGVRRAPIPFGIVGALLGYFIPGYILSKVVRKRRIRITRELPAVLDLIVVCLEAGLGIFESIRIVGRESQRQGRLIGDELAMAAAEMSAGVSLENSLRDLAERTGVEELKALTALVIQSEKMGARLGPALRSSAEMLSARRRMRAEEAAQKSTIKMLFPLVLFILPAMMIVILGPALIQIVRLLTS